MQQDNDTPDPSPLPEFAAHDPDCVLAPGLFRSLPARKDARKHRLEVNYRTGGEHPRRVQFLSPDLLGADDMRVLQGLLAVARGWDPDTWLRIDRPEDKRGEQLALQFDAKDMMYNQIAVRLEGSFAAVARAVGLDPTSGGAIETIRASIKRLAGLTVFVEVGRYGGSCHFLSCVWGDKPGRKGGPGSLVVALNPLLAQAALAAGNGKWKWIRIDMREVRALRSDPARLIHQRLCGWIDQGKSGRVKLDTLCAYVWPDKAKTRGARYWRRKRVRRVLDELKAFERPWTVTEYARGVFEIGRPARPAVEILGP